MITKLMIAIVVILFIMGTGCLILDQQDKNRKLEKQKRFRQQEMRYWMRYLVLNSADVKNWASVLSV